MKSKYNPSVNIIRDAQRELNYIVTVNAERSAFKILNNFKKGIHSYSIIGSYGTGKSSFLWALQMTLTTQKKIFDLNLPSGINNVEVINFVGDYCSLIDTFNDVFFIKNDFVSNQKLFDRVYDKYTQLGKNGLLVIAIDEFGKHLEYAANNNPEKEMYFIQQLAEFVNEPSRNIILLTTLHQGLDTYAYQLSDTQKNEWRKVKGRLKEIPFNEPVEQLLSLASKHFVNKLGLTEENEYSKSLIELQKSHYIFSADISYFAGLKNSLYPLDIFSAYIITLALQKYGQNERSLFSFLQAADSLGLNDSNRKESHFSISAVYDYLLSNYYTLLTTKANSDLSNWNSIKNAQQRIEVLEGINVDVADEIIKTIGMLFIFASKGAKIDDSFLTTYLSNKFNKDLILETLGALVKAKIIRFSNFKSSYQLFEGSDLNIEDALLKAENQVAEVLDLLPKLQTHFEFPIITAKAASYKTGTPRLFEYKLSEKPISKIPNDEIDGYINLVFNLKLDGDKIKEITANENNAIIYAFFKNTDKISATLFDIEKTRQVLKNIENDGDKIAIKELQSILNSNKALLNHYVIDALFNEQKVEWIYKGKSVKIDNKRKLNKMISVICNEVYYATPILKNELLNRHKVSPAITSARKKYWAALANHSDKEDLGFDLNRFPPEKTIYYSLLKKNDIHIKGKDGYILWKPNESADIYNLWKVSEEFLSSSKNERKNLTELIETLTAAPYKIKQGVIDFWIPTFLFIRKGDYALYDNGIFKPYINEQQLFLISKNPQHFQVKSFELNDLRLSFFNKYREILRQEDSENLSVNSFIESIRPILLMFRDLTPYAQNTNRISKQAIELRRAIKYAEDPEKVFFDEFPNALGFDTADLLKSDKKFDDYIYKFQNTLEEIKDAYNQLLNRFEQFISTEILGEKLNFIAYKNALSMRFSSLKEHQLLPNQKTFIQRLNSPLEDRDSWLASIGQAIVGKPLTSINDKDENTLKDNFKFLVKELDNLIVLDDVKYDSEKEDIFKLDFTTKKGGLIPHTVRVSKSKMEKAKNQILAIQKELGNNKQTRIAILAKLLREELENE